MNRIELRYLGEELLGRYFGDRRRLFGTGRDGDDSRCQRKDAREGVVEHEWDPPVFQLNGRPAPRGEASDPSG
jgi:hypothetical protein